VTLLPLSSSTSCPPAKLPKLDASPHSAAVYFTSGDDDTETARPSSVDTGDVADGVGIDTADDDMTEV